MEALINRIINFVEEFDPYGYSESENSIAEIVEALEEDAAGIINWLASFLEEDDNIAARAAALIADITERRTAA